MDFSWFLFCAISALYINALLTNICYEKLKPLHQLIVFLCCTAVTFFMPQSTGVWVNVIGFLLVYLFIIYLQKHPFLNAIGMMLNYILGVSINYLIIAILYLIKVDLNLLTENLFYYFIFSVVQMCIMYPLTSAAGRCYRKLIRLKILPIYQNRTKRKILYLMSFEIILCGFIFIFNVIFGNYIGYTSPILLFNSILFLLFFISAGVTVFCLYKVIQENFEFQARISQADSLSEYACRLESLYQEIRGFKHDYMNILSSMYSYVEEERFGELKQYLEKKLLPEGRHLASEDNVIGRLGNLKILELKGLLYIKVLRAADSDLRITIDIPEEIREINMDIPDLVRIAGILFDNAIEAAALTSEKELYFGILHHNEDDYLRITNSSSPVENLHDLFKEGYSLKEGHHGIGLYEVKNLLKKYPESILNTEYSEGHFSQTLQIKRPHHPQVGLL